MATYTISAEIDREMVIDTVRYTSSRYLFFTSIPKLVVIDKFWLFGFAISQRLIMCIIGVDFVKRFVLAIG